MNCACLYLCIVIELDDMLGEDLVFITYYALFCHFYGQFSYKQVVCNMSIVMFNCLFENVGTLIP